MRIPSPEPRIMLVPPSPPVPTRRAYDDPLDGGAEDQPLTASRSQQERSGDHIDMPTGGGGGVMRATQLAISTGQKRWTVVGVGLVMLVWILARAWTIGGNPTFLPPAGPSVLPPDSKPNRPPGAPCGSAQVCLECRCAVNYEYCPVGLPEVTFNSSVRLAANRSNASWPVMKVGQCLPGHRYNPSNRTCMICHAGDRCDGKPREEAHAERHR